ncbi:hypothetical protein STVA_18520 [Allostella vacuolata]|nr:hypothetical protein STVA_18520 [Stella vacuolata]
MRGLRDLLASPGGRDWLRASGVFADPGQFLAALAAPADLRGRDAPCPVYVHQQPAVDQRRSVVAKLAALEALRRAAPAAVTAVFVVIDTDRAASGRAATRIGWQDTSGRQRPLKVAPPGTEAMEFRHVTVDPAQAARVAATLEAYLRQMPGDRAACLARLDVLRPLLAPARPMPLVGYAEALGGFLLEQSLGRRPATVLVSALARDGLLAGPLSRLMEGLDAFVACFNARVAALRACGIDPAVAPLAEGYLPLFHCCPVDGERIRLHRRRAGGGWEAVGQTRAGRRYAFPLGPRGTSLDALFATGRWSPDVVLPVLLNDRFSGLVAGRSSALYCLVLNAAMAEALGMRPIPILAPAALGGAMPGPDGLVQSWLTG